MFKYIFIIFLSFLAGCVPDEKEMSDKHIFDIISDFKNKPIVIDDLSLDDKRMLSYYLFSCDQILNANDFDFDNVSPIYFYIKAGRYDELLSYKSQALSTLEGAISYNYGGVNYIALLNSPIIYASEELGELDAIKALSKSGLCDTGWKDDCFFISVKKGCDDIIKYLIHDGIDINKLDDKGNAALHYTASNNQIELTKVLLENNADINVKDKNGVTPLHVAVYEDNVEFAKLLLENGADINILSFGSGKKNNSSIKDNNNYHGPRTPRDYAHSTEMWNLLLSYGAKSSKELLGHEYDLDYKPEMEEYYKKAEEIHKDFMKQVFDNLERPE